jgi:hypothetical protein
MKGKYCPKSWHKIKKYWPKTSLELKILSQILSQNENIDPGTIPESEGTIPESEGTIPDLRFFSARQVHFATKTTGTPVTCALWGIPYFLKVTLIPPVV